MTLLFEIFARILEHALRPLPAWLLALLPLVIAMAGAASLNARSDDRIRATVQVVTGVALGVWMLLPWHPQEVELIGMNRIMTTFAFGYIAQDWLREALRSGLYPRWAHGLVILWLLATTAALLLAPAAA